MGARDAILATDRLSVVFKPGASALGHHWILRDGSGEQLGRTKLFYEGAGKSVGRLLRATGISTKGSIHVAVIGADGNEWFRLHSIPKDDPRVEVTGADGTPIGRTRRQNLSLELLGPEGDQPLARISSKSSDDETFPIEAASGAQLGALSRKQLEAHGSFVERAAAVSELVALSTSFSDTMHLGFANSREYHLLVESRPTSEPLATLLSLSPIIAAYAY